MTFANLKSRLQGWARSLKRQIMILWFCARNPETPWLARVLVVCVVAYALSPIDLIPDFIPVLGYLDDAILLPLGILLALRLLPPPVLAAGRQQAEEWERRQVPRPVNWPAAGLILLLWALGIVLVGRWLMA
ncbi:Protein of unknown function [Azotobacter beijerinckii]|uniref:DUF1232 domain-containing protein n=2 Tax=Azotobacter beijerinckii TaxID=170623 RepID=A0A1I4AU54_9GAMM|nr:Protein of unknown function [Azotobacter beijerinckii]SFK59944.1 Protein of unknown function [Azotobacter beijerinckii]